MKGSEAFNLFLPQDLLGDASKDYNNCLLLGWEGIKGQFFIIDAYAPSNKLSKVLDFVKDSRLENVTWMKNGLQLFENLRLCITRETDRITNLQLTDVSTGNKVQNVVVFVYKNYFFDIKSGLFENLKVNSEKLEDPLDPNCDIGPCLLLATAIRSYINTMVNTYQSDPDKPCDLRFITSFNRKSSPLSNFVFIAHLIVVKFTFYLSLFTHFVLTFLNRRAKRGFKMLNFIPKYSQFFSLLFERLVMLGQWHISYKELLNKTKMNEYFMLRNELMNFMFSFYFSLIGGFLEFFLYKKLVFNLFNHYKIVLRSYYIQKLKSLFYYLTTKIFIYIKLNNEVSASLAKFVVNKVMVWRYLSEKLEPFRAFLLKALEYSALLGLSAQASVLYDWFSFETMHLYYLYFIMLSIMSYSQKYLYTLLHLFKGKKWNILKSVLDTNEFTKEQLFIGVVFFVIFTLNYPTIWIFYISAVTILTPILLVKVLLLSLVELVSGLPYYVLAYNFLPNKYADGVYFKNINFFFHEFKPVGLNGLYFRVVPTKISLVKYTEELKRRLWENLQLISPPNILRKVIKCNDIFC